MNADTGKVIILITTSSESESRKISDLLLNQKKAACVSIINGVKSGFWWQGKIDRAEESLLIVKTRVALLPEIIELVKQVHSYEVPEIIALPIIGGNPTYLGWVDEVTGWT